MTLNLKDNNWVKAGLIATLAILAISVWLYVSGGIFLTAFNLKFEDATPLTLYQYWYHYGSEKQVQKWLIISSLLAFALLLSPAAFFFAPAKRSLFGDARFATKKEIKKTGLLGTKGIILGLYMRTYLMFGGSQHVIMSAPTRSGKGVGVVIPNLLTWPDSVVVLDIKQENHAITSGFRHKHGQPCYLFNPAATDYRTHRYNPLSYISENKNFRIDDIQKISNMLFPDQPGTDVIWTSTPRSLFLGIVLYLLETPGKLVTFGQVLRETHIGGDSSGYFTKVIHARMLGEKIKNATANEAIRQALSDLEIILKDKGKAPEHHPHLGDMTAWYHLSNSYRDTIKEKSLKNMDISAILDGRDFDKASVKIGKALSSECVMALNSYTSIASDNTRSGIITSFRSSLELWMNPLVDAATSTNDFDLRDVRKRRISIYLGVTPDNLERMAPLLNLFFQQLIDVNTRELPERNPELKYQCLILADEFTAMGKVPILSKGIGYIAGYGLRMLPIVQSPSQVVDVYGEKAAETFTTNHAAQIVFPPKASELKTAKDISEWLGYQTVVGKSESKGKGLFSKKQVSESSSDQRRALLLPQEITSLGKEKQLVIVEDCPPILAKKIRYYKDHVFMDRLKSVSPSLKAFGKKLPNKTQLEHIVMSGELAANVTLIDLEAHHRLVTDSITINITTLNTDTKLTTLERPFTHNDIPNLAKLGLASFAIDFSMAEQPNINGLDEAALHAYADNLCKQAGINL